MKTTMILIMSLLCNIVLADCDYTQIKKQSDDSYLYTRELHICVGQSVQDNKAKDVQIVNKDKALQMKDLALDAADKRTELWMDTAGKATDRANKITSLEGDQRLLVFGLGIFAGLAAAWIATMVIK